MQLGNVVKVEYKSEWQRQPLTDFTFNLGIGDVKASTLLKKLNSEDHVGVCQQLSRWVNGRVKSKLITLHGFVTRRDKTMPYCLGELSYDKQKQYEAFEELYNEIAAKQKEIN